MHQSQQIALRINWRVSLAAYVCDFSQFSERQALLIIGLFGCTATEDSRKKHIKQWVLSEVITSKGKFR